MRDLIIAFIILWLTMFTAASSILAAMTLFGVI